jgi:hypothetical protein
MRPADQGAGAQPVVAAPGVLPHHGRRCDADGGRALELRPDRTRTTNGVDLRMTGSPDVSLTTLKGAGWLGLGDFMTFEVVTDNDYAEHLGGVMQSDHAESRTYRAGTLRIHSGPRKALPTGTPDRKRGVGAGCSSSTLRARMARSSGRSGLSISADRVQSCSARRSAPRTRGRTPECSASAPPASCSPR